MGLFHKFSWGRGQPKTKLIMAVAIRATPTWGAWLWRSSKWWPFSPALLHWCALISWALISNTVSLLIAAHCPCPPGAGWWLNFLTTPSDYITRCLMSCFTSCLWTCAAHSPPPQKWDKAPCVWCCFVWTKGGEHSIRIYPLNISLK